jgi:hypothetical protein
VAGALASFATTFITTPWDVVTQRLMVQDTKQTQFRRYKGGLDAFRVILSTEGIRGLVTRKERKKERKRRN